MVKGIVKGAPAVATLCRVRRLNAHGIRLNAQCVRPSCLHVLSEVYAHSIQPFCIDGTR